MLKRKDLPRRRCAGSLEPPACLEQSAMRQCTRPLCAVYILSQGRISQRSWIFLSPAVENQKMHSLMLSASGQGLLQANISFYYRLCAFNLRCLCNPCFAVL